MLKDFYGAGDLTVIGFFFFFFVLRLSFRNITQIYKASEGIFFSFKIIKSIHFCFDSGNLDVSCETNFPSSLYPHLISDLTFFNCDTFFRLDETQKVTSKDSFRTCTLSKYFFTNDFLIVVS